MSWLHLDVRSASLSAAILLLVAVVARLTSKRMLSARRARFVSAAAFETAVVCALFALWQVANAATHHAHAGGVAHGQSVWNLERTLHVPSETSFQHLVIGHAWLVRAGHDHPEGVMVGGEWVVREGHHAREEEIARGYRDAMGFLIIIAVLLIKPTGLFARAERIG